MFKATKPFNDKLTDYPKEPSLRIGRCVPKDAVNLAYYYNPTATDAEKVLAAEAPRQTIDHRVEEAYRYLFNQASDDDDLFPKSVLYEDEEGYQGRLGRMYVNWYPEAHIETKNVKETKEQIVSEKNNVLKMIEYSDPEGYTGNLYFDTADYEVTKTKDVTKEEILDYEVYDHELSYHTITKTYISPNNIDAWMEPPTATTSTKWPKRIYVEIDKLIADGGTNVVKNYIASQPNNYDEAQGYLIFDKLEYEQVPGLSAVSGAITQGSFTKKLKSDAYKYTGDETDEEAANEYYEDSRDDALDLFPSCVEATYDSATDKYDYKNIKDFIKMAEKRGAAGCSAITEIKQAMKDGDKDIVIYMDKFDMSVSDKSNLKSKFYFYAKYKYKISDKGAEGTYMYNVIARYKGVLKRRVITKKEVPAEFKATCHYVGIARKVWYDYDGVAYYRGAVTKGNAVGNVNPDGDNELLMFSDKNGYLRMVKGYDKDNNPINFYRVESDHIYLTDVFKDGVACFYKYPLKLPIYDYRGPDDNGFYEGDAVKIFTSGLKDVPENYKHNMKLRVLEYETVEDITDDFHKVTKDIPKRYGAELYTSFISSSTDTFKIVYNAYNDSEEDNIVIDNGIIEDIYNYPFMHKNIDFFLEPVDTKARMNKIKLPEPRFIPDTRRYVTFSYKIKAERKPKTLSDTDPGAVIETQIRWASILNKDYVVPAEYNKFIDRAMNISPLIDGILCSPLDLILYDQAAYKIETVITKESSKNFIFSASIVQIEDIDRGGVNLKCNTDGSGYITAETTIETGFFDERLGTYTKKLCLDNPYIVEDGCIYPGFKVKCIDTRHIKVQAPREDLLLESWYPRIQFGHYSQILDQYGTHIKVCYTMPEYDKQHYSKLHGCPYVDIKNEQVTILNSHMVKTKCFPLYIKEIYKDDNTYIYKNKVFKVFKKNMSWKEAQAFCESIGGNLAMPKTKELSDFIVEIATKYYLNGLWLGGTDEETEGVWKWVDGTSMTYTNWSPGEPNNVISDTSKGEHYLEVYTSNGTWNDLPNAASSSVAGFICEFNVLSTIKLFKKVDNELFELKVKDVSFSDGIIITEETISENDCVICDYTYTEESYVYRGYWRNENDFARIDLNPNKYHTYSDLNYIPSEVKPSRNLFNKVIYFFMKPTVEYEIDSSSDDLIYSSIYSPETDKDIGKVILENKDTLYHQIDNAIPESDHDIYIGSVYIRQNTSLHSTVLTDSRTRGGGVLESMKDSLRKELEPESDYYLDIGYYDGEPYQENGVIIVRLDNSLLKEFGGRFTQGDIETKVKRWLGFGVYPIIEYVDSYSKRDMPQYNLKVEDSYTNVIDITPEIYLDCDKIPGTSSIEIGITTTPVEITKDITITTEPIDTHSDVSITTSPIEVSKHIGISTSSISTDETSIEKINITVESTTI